MPKVVVCDRCNHIADDKYDTFKYFQVGEVKGDGEENSTGVYPSEYYLCQTCYVGFKQFIDLSSSSSSPTT